MWKQAFEETKRLQGIIEDLAHEIWNHPEPSFEEYFAADLYKKVLAEHGFRIREVPDMPTALIAEYGSGRPILGVLGEYDALPELSQEVVAEKRPIKDQRYGHGCGHNLLGAGAAGACLAARYLMEKEQLSGTIRFYGCPAEEVGKGKRMMDERGLFDDLTAAFSWHPGAWNAVSGSTLSALMKVEFRFTGIAAHAGAHPELGRSALDAVELMNVGANYLREHLPPGGKLHYIITNGGQAANIVPEKASVYYILRSPKKRELKEIFDRLVKVARGAAMMTETQEEHEVDTYTFDTLNNTVLEDFTADVLDACGEMTFSKEEKDFAKALVGTLPKDCYQRGREEFGLKEGVVLDGVCRGVMGRGLSFGASSDIGQVSQKAPLVQLSATSFPVGTPLHTWQATASAGSSIGFHSAVHVAKVISASMIRLLEQGDDVLRQALEEYRNKKDDTNIF